MSLLSSPKMTLTFHPFGDHTVTPWSCTGVLGLTKTPPGAFNRQSVLLLIPGGKKLPSLRRPPLDSPLLTYLC